MLTTARAAFPTQACVYVQSDPNGFPVRVGKASKGLEVRYSGGTCYAVDAAMHGSENLVFVAPVPVDLCEAVERELIWQGRSVLTYNNIGKDEPPVLRRTLHHTGTTPVFDHFQP
jgi:hypothetical protein